MKFQAALTLAEREDVNGVAILGCFLDAEDNDLRSKAIEALKTLGPKASRGLTEMIYARLKELTQLQQDMHYLFSSRDYQGGRLSQEALRAAAMRASGQAIMSVKSKSFITLMKFLVKIGDKTNVHTFKLISELVHDRGIREEAAKAIESLESLPNG